MRAETKTALITAAEVLTENAVFFAERAKEQLAELRKAATEYKAACAGKHILFWFVRIDEERDFFDRRFNEELGPIWEEVKKDDER